VAVSHLQDARYRQADGALVAFGSDVRVGDMLLWNRHVAVIAEVDPSGHLTPDTLIIHTVVESAALVPLREVGFGFDRAPFEVRRLKRRSR
jgi:hypothetical protein